MIDIYHNPAKERMEQIVKGHQFLSREEISKEISKESQIDEEVKKMAETAQKMGVGIIIVYSTVLNASAAGDWVGHANFYQ